MPRRIFIQTLFGGNGRLFDPNLRDGISEPFIVLRDMLSKRGYSLETADQKDISQASWVLFWDAITAFPYRGPRGGLRYLNALLKRRPKIRNLYKECVSLGFEEKVALFAWEPPAVSSMNWRKQVHRSFKHIFTWNDAYVDGERVHKVYCPVPRTARCNTGLPFAKRKLLVNISMNKYSSHPRELYSARRESIRYFQSNYANQFDLFGVGWGEMARPRGGYGRRYQWHYPSYKGEVENKSEVLGCYKFALCYENMSGELGHVTEKIFDIIMSDCVPIYWGAANVESYVNHRAFIDRRNFLDNAALGAFLSGISEVAYREYIEAGKMYLSSGDFRRFLPEAFATSIIEPLGLDV